jgi:hypothetical protein
MPPSVSTERGPLNTVLATLETIYPARRYNECVERFRKQYDDGFPNAISVARKRPDLG